MGDPTKDKKHKWRRKVRKGDGGSVYWGYYGAGIYAREFKENQRANPDSVSDEDMLVYKSNLTDQGRARLQAYERVVSKGILEEVLTESELKAWKLMFVKNKTSRQVAERLKMKPQSVNVLIRRAGRKIRFEVLKNLNAG